MEIKSIDGLSEKLLEEFGDRKREGRLDLVYDVDSEKFYPVPKNMEHKDFMPQLEGHPKSLIPVQLRLHKKNEKKIVTDLLVGASSFEAECGVRHNPAYLIKAYEQTLILLNKYDDFEIANKARLKIMHRFSEKNSL